MSQSGLSIGQREALDSKSPSKFEGVMGDVASTSKKAQRVIDINDLDIPCPLVDDGSSDSSGASDVATEAGGSAKKRSSSGMEASATPNTPAGTYLNNPVLGESAWLHNQQLPSVIIKHEKVEHRIMLFWKAQGKSNREIAQLLGYSDAQVSQITRQRWFLQDLKELLVCNGADLVKRMLEGTAVDSVVTLIAVRDDPKSPAAVKLNAANALLDRFMGKPKQEVHVERKEAPATQMEKVDNELDVLKKREDELLKQLGAGGTRN